MSREVFAVGGRIKDLRLKNDWTLQDLSRRSNVSISALSKIENGNVVASFDTLLKIARGLDITFEALLETEDHSSPASRLTVNKGSTGLPFETNHYKYTVLSAELRNKNMIPMRMVIKERSVDAITEWSSHSGEEFIYVLSGSVELHTEFYEPQLLEAGESAYFDSLMRHAIVNRGSENAEVLSICFSRGLFFPDPSGGIDSGGRRLVKVGG